MIGRLRGELIQRRPPFLLLDVGGVGYELEAPLSVFYDLPAEGQTVTLFTHLLVREDAQILYAFSDESQRSLFRALLKVSGVGAKMALAILSGMSAAEFAQAVQHEDSSMLVRLPGIGKKTAQRLIVEMQGRLEGLEAGPGPALPSPRPPGAPAPPPSPLNEAVEALTALGYKPAEAARLVRGVEGEGATSEELIRAALKRAL